MKRASSARSKFLKIRLPMNFGFGGVYPVQSIGVLLARASSSGHSTTGFLPACRARTRS
ncbi:MAG: hypothetical protein BWX79_02965 [Alphaproteobacteria bacterium ADurb.Bin100]|nr:MAG: hypothetical protein BWX79_02965 [Alphaproteobacteria bacterium ADurb.Bin100]